MKDTKKTNRTVTTEQKIKILREVMATPEFAKMAKKIDTMTPVERSKLAKRIKDGEVQTKVKILDCSEPDIDIVIVFDEIALDLLIGIAVVGLVIFGVITFGTDIEDVPDAGPTDEPPTDAGVPDA